MKEQIETGIARENRRLETERRLFRHLRRVPREQQPQWAVRHCV